MLDYQEQTEKISQWIKTITKKQGFSKIIIAVSGGIDSATVLTLAVRALGKENIYALLLPNGNESKKATDDGLKITAFVNLPKEQVIINDISSIVNEFTKQYAMNNIRKGNIIARIRMMYLYDRAKELSSLVCGTENKSEYYLGYFTRFGDEASDIEPIRHLYKTQIFALAEHLKIPRDIIMKKPTADLWKNQTDEEEMGFTYHDADQIIYQLFDQKISRSTLEKNGISGEIIDKIIHRVQVNDFKHHVPLIYPI